MAIRNLFFPIVCISSFICPSLHWAQAKSDSLKIKEIQEIIIATKRQDIGIISSQKLSGKELENMNALSVADAVRYFSGIQLKDYGGIGGLKTINIRGMGTQHTGVFYDGIQLGNAQNGMVDLGRFSLDNLASISMYNGQKSEIFQSAKDFGASGSIYLESKTPQFSGNKKSNLSLNYRSGSFGLINPSLLYEQKLTNHWHASLSTELISADGQYPFYQRVALPDGSLGWERKGTRTNGDINAFRGELGIFGKVNHGKWHLKSYFYNSERGIPGAITKNVEVFSSRQWDRNFFVQGKIEKEPSEKYRYQISAKLANDHLRYLNDNPLGTSIKIDNSYDQKELYLSTTHQYTILPFWKISLALDYQWNKMDANLRDFAYPERHTELIALASQFRWGQLSLQGSLLGTFVQENVKNNKFALPKDRQEYSPALFISYQPFSQSEFKVHSFYKNTFRLPTFNDLYYTDIGSSLLKPEYTQQYDVGVTYNKDFEQGVLKNINLIADVYYNRVKDKIIAYPKGQLFRWTMLNLGEVEIKGLDLSTQAIWLVGNQLYFSTRFTYTFEEALDVTQSQVKSYYRHQIPYIPRHSGTALLGLTYKDWQLNYNFIYTGERYNQNANLPENYEQPWYTSDIAASKLFSLNQTKIKLGLEINNLLNQNYSVIRNYPMPGRNYRVSLRFNF